MKYIFILVALIGSVYYYINLKNNGNEINVYSSRKEELTKEIFEGFTKKTGIKVNYIIDKAPILINRIELEGENTPADVLLTTDIANLHFAKEKNLLRRIKSKEVLNNIPADLTDKDNEWIALTKRVRAIFYSKERVKKESIKNYEDLLNEQFKGKVLIRSSSNIYNQSLIASLIKNIGKDNTQIFIRSLVKNFARKPQGGDTDQLIGILNNKGDVAVANSYYYARLVNKDPSIKDKIGIIFPNQDNFGAHINISGAAIIKYSKNVKNAELFLEYLSSDAQFTYANKNFEYPIKGNINPIVKEFGSFKADNIDFTDYINNASKFAKENGWK